MGAVEIIRENGGAYVWINPDAFYSLGIKPDGDDIRLFTMAGKRYRFLGVPLERQGDWAPQHGFFYAERQA